MPDVLTEFVPATPVVPLTSLVRLVSAAVLGAFVAWVYRRARRDTEPGSTFPTTLVLLAVLIAMVTQVIGSNVALAFSLVGALSIVRFRTVVRDTQDTAYLIFAVVVGMAVGAGHGWVAVIGLPVVSAVAFLTRRPPADAAALPVAATIRVAVGLDVATVEAALDRLVVSRRLDSVATTRQGLSLELCYELRPHAGLATEAIVRALNRTDGVQAVELRRVGAGEAVAA